MYACCVMLLVLKNNITHRLEGAFCVAYFVIGFWFVAIALVR